MLPFLLVCLFAVLFLKSSTVSAAGLFNFTQCAINVNETFTSAFNSTSLVASDGRFTANLAEAWGIKYMDCVKICGGGWEAFDWAFFSTSVGAWLLPWLAFTAQLPYETKDSFTDLLSLHLAIGSPMLITYSLCLRVLNSRWINMRFRRLRCQNEEVGGRQVAAMEAARVFLRESQHVPIGISGSRSTIAQLIVSPANASWWESLQEKVLDSKREWTYSLLASVIWVCIAVISAVSGFFTSNVDNNTMGIGVAINSLWIWMIPVTLGSVWVGTQRSASSIRKALRRSEATLLVRSPSGDHEPHRVRDRMTGFRDRTCDEFCDVEDFDLEMDPLLSDRVPPRRTFFGSSLAGFDMEAGPVFVYARAWQHLRTAQYMIDAFETLNARLKDKRPVRQSTGWDDDANEWKHNLEGTPEEMEAYIFPLEYRVRVVEGLTGQYLIATFVALILQWGTTGAAILIAYNTPVIGLGCESGSYLLYGSMSTLSWALLTLSAYLSQKYTSPSESSLPPQRTDRTELDATTTFGSELRSLLSSKTETDTVPAGLDGRTESDATTVFGTELRSLLSARIETDTVPEEITGLSERKATTDSNIELRSLNSARPTGRTESTATTSGNELRSLLSDRTERGEPLRRTSRPSPILALSIVLTRFLGQFFAVINAFWLVLISFLQFSNVYSNCWCEGSVLGLGSKAWVILWASDSQIVAAAWDSWILAVVMSALTLVFAGGFFVTMRGEEIFNTSPR